MPRRPDLSWTMKTAIWDLASKLGPKLEAILRDLEKLCRRDMPLEGETPPDSRTVKSVIQELQTLKLEVLATLPRRIWQLRGDYHTIRAELETLVAGGTLEDLPNVAGKLKIQLHIPAPETVLIDDFDGPGKHRIHLKQDTIKVIQENLGYGISMFKAIRESSSAGSGEINLEVSTYGDLKLRCLVKGEDYALSKKLILTLSETAQQKFETWKQRGGQYLGKCSEIYREIHTEASYKTGQSIYEFGSRVFSKLGPPLLTPLFGDLVYQLCIWHRRSRGRYGLPDRRLYQIKRRGLIFSALYLGQMHLANAPLSPPRAPPPPPPPPSFLPPFPYPPPPPSFLETWIDLHRNMIMKWSASPSIIELLGLFENLRGIEAAIKQELDDVIRGKQP